MPGAVLVAMLLRTSGTALHRALERSEIVFLGKIFYGMYLWHYPILMLMKDLGASNLVLVSVGFPLTVLMATLSYAYIERHFMRVRSAPTAAGCNGADLRAHFPVIVGLACRLNSDSIASLG